MKAMQAHAINLTELQKFDFVCSLDYFSVASYKTRAEDPLKAFRHSHDEYEFIIPLQTISLFYYDKANYLGEVGYVYPIEPYIEHGIEQPLQSNLISVAINKAYFDKIKDALGYQDRKFKTRFIFTNRLLEFISRFKQDFQNNSPERDRRLTLCAREICSLLIKTGLELVSATQKPQMQYNRNIKNILIYMNQNFRDPNLTIAKLADMSGYSLSYFTKAFKAYMRDTPIVHLNKLKISEAKMLIIEGKLPLGEIAKKCGFRNFSTFTEAFKSIMEMSPSEYKKIFNS